MRRGIKVFTSTALAAAMILGLGACGKVETGDNTQSTEATSEDVASTSVAAVEEAEGNILKNGYFSSDDVSAWSIEGGSLGIEVISDGNGPDGFPTYGKINRDPESSSPYDCFAQDVTDSLEGGVTYDYEFYAMLSDEYEGAPADQRVVDFAPYITVDGNTTYLGSYSAEITGNPSETLTPGEWKKFSGTFTPSFSGKAEKAVIRIIEQGTDYGNGTCVKGDYYIAGVKLVPQDGGTATAIGVEEDIVDLRSVVASSEGLGDDAIIGC